MKPDQSENVAKIADTVPETEREAEKLPLFVIVGASASGKSLFGRALAEDGTETAYVDLQPGDSRENYRPHLRDNLFHIRLDIHC